MSRAMLASTLIVLLAVVSLTPQQLFARAELATPMAPGGEHLGVGGDDDIPTKADLPHQPDLVDRPAGVVRRTHARGGMHPISVFLSRPLDTIRGFSRNILDVVRKK